MYWRIDGPFAYRTIGTRVWAGLVVLYFKIIHNNFLLLIWMYWRIDEPCIWIPYMQIPRKVLLHGRLPEVQEPLFAGTHVFPWVP